MRKNRIPIITVVTVVILAVSLLLFLHGNGANIPETPSDSAISKQSSTDSDDDTRPSEPEQSDDEPSEGTNDLANSIPDHVQQYTASSPEIQEILANLNLTDEGWQIVHEIDQVLIETKDVCDGFIRGAHGFDSSTVSITYIDKNANGKWDNDEGVQIDGGGIFIHNVIGVETFLAHELLHGAFFRLSTDDRIFLREELEKVYERYQEELEPYMAQFRHERDESVGEMPETFDLATADSNGDKILDDPILYLESVDGIWLSELHSYVGTLIADLPDGLENHYGRYFSDRAGLVMFYNPDCSEGSL